MSKTAQDIELFWCFQALVMRMNLLPRLRHILSQSHPQAPAVLQCIDILVRIVKHSPQMAYEV